MLSPAAGIAPSESGEVGQWRLTITENGRITFEGPGVNLDVPVKVKGDTMTVTIDNGSIDVGRGEVWRYSWSVFRDKLTLERLPGPGFQAGPHLPRQPTVRASLNSFNQCPTRVRPLRTQKHFEPAEPLAARVSAHRPTQQEITMTTNDLSRIGTVHLIAAAFGLLAVGCGSDETTTRAVATTPVTAAPSITPSTTTPSTITPSTTAATTPPLRELRVIGLGDSVMTEGRQRDAAFIDLFAQQIGTAMGVASVKVSNLGDPARRPTRYSTSSPDKTASELSSPMPM